MAKTPAKFGPRIGPPSLAQQQARQVADKARTEQRLVRYQVKSRAEATQRAAQSAERFANLSGVNGRATMRREALAQNLITRDMTKGVPTAVLRENVALGREARITRMMGDLANPASTGRTIAPHLSKLRSAGSARLGGDGGLISVKASAGGGSGGRQG